MIYFSIYGAKRQILFNDHEVVNGVAFNGLFQ